MNMVRAGVVKHPCDWSASGYHEIQTSSQRYRIVDLEALYAAMWSQSIAIGSEKFVEKV
ncbi:MAG: hypothetical protein P8Y28_15390 [Gammaproteobacteria bacterium]